MVDTQDVARDPIRLQRIVVGSVTESFSDCERDDRSARIDVDLARQQHRGYVEALEAGTEHVQRIACNNAHPDAVFVEDNLVVLNAERAVLTRPGVASRRTEPEVIAAALGSQMTLERMRSPAALDGGDVLRVGAVLVIGLSARTNAQGAEVLVGAARECGVHSVTVPVPRGLHLKSACSLANHELLVFDPAAGLELARFRDLGLCCVAAGEPAGANVLALGAGQVLVSASAPITQRMLADRGLDVTSVPMSEFHKADGALTCCSIRIPPPGGWCT